METPPYLAFPFGEGGARSATDEVLSMLPKTSPTVFDGPLSRESTGLPRKAPPKGRAGFWKFVNCNYIVILTF